MWKQGTHPPHTPWEASCVPDTKPPGPCLPAQPGAPVRFEGRPSALRPRPPLSTPLFSAGAGAGGQSSLRASRLSFDPLVASWPAPPSTYAHWSPGRRGLSCLREQPVGQSGRGASREGTVEAAGGRPFYPGSSGGPTAGRPRTRRPSHPSGRAPDTDSSAELEGTSEPSWFQWGHGAQRGAVACPGSAASLLQSPICGLSPGALGSLLLGRTGQTIDIGGSPLLKQALGHPALPPECWVTRGQGPALRAAVSPSGSGRGPLSAGVTAQGSRAQWALRASVAPFSKPASSCFYSKGWRLHPRTGSIQASRGSWARFGALSVTWVPGVPHTVLAPSPPPAPQTFILFSGPQFPHLENGCIGHAAAPSLVPRPLQKELGAL